MVIKYQLNLSSKITTAVSADLMESPLGSWLKNNHITVDIIIFYFGTGLSQIQCLCDVQIQPRLQFAGYCYLTHYFLRSLLVSEVFYEVFYEFQDLFLYFSILFCHQKSQTLHFNLSKHLENIQYAFTGGKQNYEVEIKKKEPGQLSF